MNNRGAYCILATHDRFCGHLRALPMCILISLLILGCNEKSESDQRQPKLLWQAELPAIWPYMTYSSAVPDPSNQRVIVTGLGTFWRKEGKVFQNIALLIYNSQNGALYKKIVTQIELGVWPRLDNAIQRSELWVRGEYSRQVISLLSADDRIIVLAPYLVPRVYQYDVNTEKCVAQHSIQPWLTLEQESYRSPELLVNPRTGMVYYFLPVGRQRFNDATAYLYDLVEFSLHNPEQRGKVRFSLRAFYVNPIPCSPYDAHLAWVHVLDKYYAGAYNSDRKLAEIVCKGEADQIKPIGIFDTIYDPASGKLLQLEQDKRTDRPILVEADFCQRALKTLWRDIEAPSRRRDEIYGITPSRKLIFTCRHRSDDDDMFEIVVLDLKTLAIEYRWSERTIFNYGLSTSHSGEYVFYTCRDPKARNHLIKCYQLTKSR
ncbi:MAG: hypothetical protein RMJ19_04905 [Gemmatales bacterium]|nr:hypothetical protein [Gemmatales bacterium]MDW8174990.1 hypothetical protein [Gemmatales bacterium]